MKRRYLTLTIRKLKVKLSHLSRTSFRITRKFFKSRLGIDKRDWSRLTKAEIIRVLNYYYDCVFGQIEQIKNVLTHFQFKSVEKLVALLPKREAGQQWRHIDRVDIGELSDSGVPLFWLHFKIVYPHKYQLSIWDNPDCFLVIAEVGKQLYGYVSQTYFNVADLLEEIEEYYQVTLQGSAC